MNTKEKELIQIELDGEVKASEHYRASAEQTDDIKLKELFLHIASEEDGHAEELRQALKGDIEMKNGIREDANIKYTEGMNLLSQKMFGKSLKDISSIERVKLLDHPEVKKLHDTLIQAFASKTNGAYSAKLVEVYDGVEIKSYESPLGTRYCAMINGRYSGDNISVAIIKEQIDIAHHSSKDKSNSNEDKIKEYEAEMKQCENIFLTKPEGDDEAEAARERYAKLEKYVEQLSSKKNANDFEIAYKVKGEPGDWKRKTGTEKSLQDFIGTLIEKYGYGAFEVRWSDTKKNFTIDSNDTYIETYKGRRIIKALEGSGFTHGLRYYVEGEVMRIGKFKTLEEIKSAIDLYDKNSKKNSNDQVLIEQEVAELTRQGKSHTAIQEHIIRMFPNVPIDILTSIVEANKGLKNANDVVVEVYKNIDIYQRNSNYVNYYIKDNKEHAFPSIQLAKEYIDTNNIDTSQVVKNSMPISTSEIRRNKGLEIFGAKKNDDGDEYVETYREVKIFKGSNGYYTEGDKYAPYKKIEDLKIAMDNGTI
jgi:hypothetical protein